jgi:hypothetical protein
MPVITSVPLPRRRTPIAFHLVGFAIFALLVAGALYLALGRGEDRGSSTRGGVAVRIEPPQGAQVFVDDELHGAADSAGRYNVPGLLAGKHRLRVQSARLGTLEQVVEVVGGQTTLVTLRGAPR